MKIRSAELETVCGITSTLPEKDRPEIAFAGKSNVGKSSLINALLLRKSLARTSSRPGKTQTINYYHINEGMTEEETEERGFAPDFYVVDLPGYGFAEVPETEKEKWGRMIERYLHTSGMLRAVVLLIDLRHLPSKNDRQMYDWIVSEGYEPLLVCTKKDKLSRNEAAKNLAAIRKALRLPSSTRLIAFSAVTKEGYDELWQAIADIVKNEP